MDGAEILKVVEERSPSTKSLVLTGYPEASPPSQPMISKPWDDAELKQRIRELTRPLPYVVLMPPEPRVRLALVGVERSIADLAPGWFEIGGTEPAELALIDAQRAGVDAARALPGAYKVLLTDDAAGARLREWYDAGVDQILRKPVSDAVVADVLRRSVPLARLRQRLAREESDRAAASWPRRLLRRVWKLGAAIPGRSTILTLAAALTLGILFATSLNSISASLAAEARGDTFADRFLRFSAQERDNAALLRGAAAEPALAGLRSASGTRRSAAASPDRGGAGRGSVIGTRPSAFRGTLRDGRLPRERPPVPVNWRCRPPSDTIPVC
jgi:DNA-binding NarL/FixJ family response regulator